MMIVVMIPLTIILIDKGKLMSLLKYVKTGKGVTRTIYEYV